MVELLSTYSLAQILIFPIVFAGAIKGFVTFYDWAIDRLRKIFNKENKVEAERKKIYEMIAKDEKHLSELYEYQQFIKEKITDFEKHLNLLIDSDRNDIKSFITAQHHKFVEQGWIDDYSMDCLEKRFQIYEKENGNSFVLSLMRELRKLPKYPS